MNALESLDQLITTTRERLKLHPDYMALMLLERTREELVALLAPQAPLNVEKLLDATTLPALTDKQAKVFWALVKAAENSPTRVAYPSLIKKLSGFANVDDALTSLRQKGYVENLGERGDWSYRALAQGTPIVDNEGIRGRPWTNNEFEQLKTTAEGDGNYDALATRINRTQIACEQQARSRGWYRNPGAMRWPAVKPNLHTQDPHPIVVMKPAHIEPSLKITLTAPAVIVVDEEAADIDDLTPATREALLALRACTGPSGIVDIRKFCDHSLDRLLLAMTRLSELKLASCDRERWSLTEHGKTIAEYLRD